jgi:hypothetical protein
VAELDHPVGGRAAQYVDDVAGTEALPGAIDAGQRLAGDLDERGQIPGIGASKLERYGEAVLQQLLDCDVA